MPCQAHPMNKGSDAGVGEPRSYAEWQQLRGMACDAIDWAVAEYDSFMLDDAYDAQRVLDRIIERLRSVPRDPRALTKVEDTE